MSIRAATVVAAATALFAGTGFAQMMDGPGGPGAEIHMPMRGFERLHKELKLNPQQEELWSKAQAAQREAFESMRAKAAETRARLRAEIDKPGVDLKQFAELGDQLREQAHSRMEAAHKQLRAAWFGVYDSLDAKQKEQVRVAIRDGMDRMGAHRGMHRGGSGGEMHGSGPAGGATAPAKAGG
ncbi:MAG TPA: periplasmic heavy metal sensor [Burkholderiales bacterium]|nr:periplasmic heavy metal sensor [Burkholderiales bacterium]